MSLAGFLLLALVWSAILWGAASLICRLRPSPRTAQAVWRGAALLLLAPVVASAFMPGFTAAAPTPIEDLPMLEPLMVQPAAETVTAETVRSLTIDVSQIVLAVLVAGWAIRAALWGVSQLRLQNLKSVARSAERPVDHWVDVLGIIRKPRIAVTPRGAPFLAGIAHPTVYVPASMIQGHDAQQIIVHELVHLKRGDLLTRPLERLAADLLWFSPFAWAMRERLDYWREAVVDEAAAELTGDRIAYARALTRAARLARPATTLPVAAFILKKEGTLKMRLTELLTDAPARPKRLGVAIAAALVLATPLALAQGSLIRGAAAPLASGVAYSHAVLDQARLTSTFGVRVHPIDKKSQKHNGVDLALAEGEPVYAPADGVVAVAEFRKGYGNLIQLDASDSVRLRFGQLSEMNVEVGQTVKAGDVIGLVGQTGRATGPHLHLEVWRGDAPVDPLTEDGLVLAGVLDVPAPPAPPSALSPSVQPPRPATPAPHAPNNVPFGPDTPPTPVPAATPAPPAPVACEELTEAIVVQPAPEAWTARKVRAIEANAEAGLSLAADWMPETVTYPAPSYPGEAAAAGMSAACEVIFDLDKTGKATNRTARCTNPAFEASAADLPGAKFKPFAGEDGQPAEVKGVVYPLLYCISG